ncbi:MAG: hypothetical protein JO125_15195 [Chloroflexi bacterium]|nr:hypothetical protein [Ktedonobacteraceae bacterium]MBV9708742.1 hypothetical protein [Chloroflexota bacterium]
MQASIKHTRNLEEVLAEVKRRKREKIATTMLWKSIFFVGCGAILFLATLYLHIPLWLSLALVIVALIFLFLECYSIAVYRRCWLEEIAQAKQTEVERHRLETEAYQRVTASAARQVRVELQFNRQKEWRSKQPTTEQVRATHRITVPLTKRDHE